MISKFCRCDLLMHKLILGKGDVATLYINAWRKVHYEYSN